MRRPGRLALAAAAGGVLIGSVLSVQAVPAGAATAGASVWLAGARPVAGPPSPTIRSYSFTDTEQLLNWGFG